MDPLNLASSFDRNYAPYFVNTVGSFLRHHPDQRLCFNLVLDKKETREYVESRCAALFPRYLGQFEINAVLMRPEDRAYFAARDRRDAELRQDIMPIHYAQLLVPRYFDLDKFLYVEPDQIAVNSVAPYYELDIGREIVAAVPSPDEYADELVFQRLGKRCLYFNAGVVLVDAASWRRNDIEAQAREILEQHYASKVPHYKFYTQGILNLLFHNAYKPLDYRLNLTYYPSYYHNVLYNDQGSFFQSEDIDEACRQAAILHVNGGHLKCDVPMIRHYRPYDANHVLALAP